MNETPGKVTIAMDRNTHRLTHGFTLVEILIVVVILAILAALVVPQFSNAAKLSRENVLKEDLRYLRSQIMVYQAQHDGVAPGYPNGDTTQTPTAEAFVAQMTSSTNAAGGVGAGPGYSFGPYLSRMPANPMNEMDSVRVVASWPAAAAGTHGWIYQPSTLRLAADAVGSDDSGTDYIDY